MLGKELKKLNSAWRLEEAPLASLNPTYHLVAEGHAGLARKKAFADAPVLSFTHGQADGEAENS